MKTTQNLWCYSDFEDTIKTKKLELTPENACRVVFSRQDAWNDQTTAIMDAFCRDQKTFMLIRYGIYNNKHIWLVAQYEPHRVAPKSAPTISNIKTASIQKPCFYDSVNNSVAYYPIKRMEDLSKSIADALTGKCSRGIYMTENHALFQAQLPEDRAGFHRNNIRGQIMGEKPYGYCSMVFSVVAVYLS